MVSEWMPEAERAVGWRRYRMSGNTDSLRVVVHTTESRPGSDPRGVASWLERTAGKTTGYTILLPTVADLRPLQLRPADVGAGSLLNVRYHPTSPNRQGTRLVQVAVCTQAALGQLAGHNGGPGPWWEAFVAWITELGVPQRYVWQNWTRVGLMPNEVWRGPASGWASHSQTPETGRVRKSDPGPVNDEMLWPGRDQPIRTVTIDVEGGGTVTLQYLELRADPIVSRDVRSCQFLVESHRIDGLPVGGLEKDSRYDKQTADAVRAFQQAKGLQVDGIVGRNTWTRLLNG